MPVPHFSRVKHFKILKPIYFTIEKTSDVSVTIFPKFGHFFLAKMPRLLLRHTFYRMEIMVNSHTLKTTK